MNLYSLGFVIMVAVSLGVYYLLGKTAKNKQWIVLLITSLVWYASYGFSKLFYILATSITVFVAATLLETIARTGKEKAAALDASAKKQLKKVMKRRQRWVLFFALLITFSFLGYVKYFNVLLQSISDITNGDFHPVSILFPLGISFFTFQSVAYLLDVYNKNISAEKNYFKFLLFVSWFPQLLQGPINRFETLSKDLFSQHRFDYNAFRKAGILLLLGLVKKYALADMLVDCVNLMLQNIDGATPGFVHLVSMFTYTIWQYADFSGGIDMVLGISGLFGIGMMPNFRQPFFATSLADFWRRWHISLGAWMRDYVFYPLAVTKPIRKISKFTASRINEHLGKVLPAIIGNIVVFLLVGLWHGATLNFILWGLYNGLIIAFSEAITPAYLKAKTRLHIRIDGKFAYIRSILFTFFLVLIGNGIECRENVDLSLHGILGIFTDFNLGGSISILKEFFSASFTLTSAAIALVAFIVVLWVDIVREKGINFEQCIIDQKTVLKWSFYIFLIMLVLFSFTRVVSGGGFAYANY
jgi:D-alanyl-lipoteichoic acid acyltransferase DltB (MBOAT superfamily)